VLGAAGLGVLAARHLVAPGGRACVDAVTAVRPDALRSLDGRRGVGEHRSRLAHLTAADDPLWRFVLIEDLRATAVGSATDSGRSRCMT
jgi:hypothetical protein